MTSLGDRFGGVNLCESVDDRCIVNAFLGSLTLTDISERFHIFFDSCVFLHFRNIDSRFFKVVVNEFATQILLGFGITRTHKRQGEVVKEFVGHFALLLCLKIRIDCVAETAFLEMFVTALLVRTLTAGQRKSNCGGHGNNENFLHFVSFR